jgi:hypothetical protein
VPSAITTVRIAAKVGIKSQRLSGDRVRFEGTISPAVPNGRVTLQRRTPSGKWERSKSGTITALDATRSRYRIPAIARRSRTTSYRVVVTTANDGANAPGTSRTIRVPSR